MSDRKALAQKPIVSKWSKLDARLEGERAQELHPLLVSLHLRLNGAWS